MDKLVDSERKNKEGDSELHTADEEHGASAVRSRKTTEKYPEWQSEQREREFKTKVSAWYKRSNKIKKLLPDSGDVLVLNHQRDAINDDMNSVFVAYNRLHEVASEMKADDIDKLLQIQNNNFLLLQDIRNRIYVIELEQADVNSSESAKTAASQSSKRSKISGISNLSRKIDAATDTAILRAKLKYIEEEAKKRTELELIQTAKELEIAQAKLEAIAKVEHDERFADVEEYGELPDESKRYVHQYVHSLKDPRSDKLPYDTVPRHDYYDNMTHPDRKPVAGINTYANEFVPVSMSVLRTHSDNEQTHATYTHPTLPSNQLDGTPAKQTPLLPDCNNAANNTVNQQVIELSRLFAEQISLSRLPPPEPGIFTGEPLKFPGWKTAFERLIEHKGIPPLEQIYYLKKYLGGDAKAAVEGYFLLDTDTAFVEAKKLLEQRYGHPFVIADAFRNKMEQWPRIPPRDSIALRKFADFLQQCETAMYSVTSLKTLDDERENRKMLLKLPEWLALRWARYVADWRDRYNAFPQFTEFCKYVTKEANVACNPITSYVTAGTNTQTRNIRGTVSFSTEVSENKTQNYSTKSSDPKLCLLCTKPHHIDDCRQFLSKSLSERKEFAKSNSLCFGCMQPGHRSKFCRQRRTCKTCSRRHPTSLHGDIRETNFSEQGVKYAESHAGTITRHGCTDLSTKCSMIVPVWVSHCDNPGVERMVYAMLDTQSDTTFILDYTCNKLGVDGPGVKLLLSTMLAKNQMVDSRKIDGLKIRGYDSLTTLSLPVTYTRGIMPCDRSHIPTPEVANQWPHLARISSKLLPLHEFEIGLLIGYNCSKALAPKDVIAPISNGPYAQLTELGWGIVGIVNPDKVESFACTHDPIGTSHRIVAYEVPPHLSVFDTISSEMCLPKCSDQVLVSFRTHVKEAIKPIDVTRMMELDFSDQESNCTPFSQEDQRFLKIMTNGIHQREDKHFEMPLPFKGSNTKLPNNKSMALHRLEQLKSRLIKNTQYYEDYRTFMQKVIVNGHAERVPEVEPEPSDGHTWYIPHHGVYHPKKPEKIRIVFDCSAKYKEESLNEHLLQGPDLTNALLGVLCRFRQDKIAIMCDIEQMFHQFRVNKEHRDFLRFLWWENGDYNNIPSVYRMNVHLFGAVSSPGCANFGLKHTATEYETECGATAADFLRRNFYVDDGLRSVESVHAALDLITSSKNMCAKGGLRLHKFVSNSKEVITAIPVEDCAKDIVQCDLGFDSLPVERALGVQWCIESDTFQFRIILKDQPLTRRGVLSTVSSIYDPLGFIAPVLLVGKQILQQMCRDQADWDTLLSDELRNEWESWRRDLFLLETMTIQRCFQPDQFGTVTAVELHHFSDASTNGYGQCSYLRMTDDQQRIHCSLVMGKARVAPLKTVTIPRLELSAAVVSVRISALLQRELEFNEMKEIFWTDSKIVLGYIINETRRFHVFVANRVQQIRNHTDPTQWRYVKSNENPADAASRGLTACEIQKSTWLNGPEFLWKECLPSSAIEPLELTPEADDPEVKRATVFTSQTTQAFELDRLYSFSSWFRLKRALALCLKLKAHLKMKTTMSSKCKEKVSKNALPLYKTITTQDLNHAELVIIRLVQVDAFTEEIKVMQALKVQSSDVSREVASSRNRAMKMTSSLYRLDPYLDRNGVIRVGGRIRRASLSFSMKHPLILPRKQHVTELIIRYFHERSNHQGRGMTTNQIRKNGFWIIGCTSAVSSYIAKCVTCRRLRSQVQEQKMADLPEDRLEPAPPFTFCGVDLFGPWYIKDGRKELKRYGALFTCMASRAIHIETTNSLSTDAFINALRRFIAIRGPIRQLRSDRGTNFVGAERELKASLGEMDHDKVRHFLLKEECDYVEFKINVPAASHMGGVWERQIRTVRSVLASVMDQAGSQLDDESLRTFMCEAAAIVNSRPLTVDNLNDPCSLEPLTPNHLLTMKSRIVLPPPGEFQRADLYSQKRWRRVQFLANEFWTRWRKEFLQTLQRRQKWTQPRRDISVGDIVLIKDPDTPRNKWQIARVNETFPDKDDHVRKAKLVLGNKAISAKGKRSQPVSYLERPIQKLVLVLLLESE